MDLDFSRKLIKGKIVELIFQEMFSLSEEFTVLPLGYEHTTPVLAQYQHHVQVKKVLENIRNAPDFALISQDKTKVFLVEVKYRHEFSKEDTFRLARTISNNWDPCFLFVATHDSFYMSPCSSIVDKGGEIEKLRESWIKKDIQEAYIPLLQEFIK